MMTKHSNQNVLNASRERMSELLSDFKKMNFDTTAPRLAPDLPTKDSLPAAANMASPHTKSSVDNEDSIEMVKAYESPLKLVALYVGDLDPVVTEEKLYRFFSGYETLSTVKICYLQGSKTSLGYGYVNFGSEKDARNALEELNYRPLLNREIRIMPSMKGKDKAFLGTNVFVSNLNTSKINTLRAFYETFRSYGSILSCKLDLTKSQGFISFEDKETAHKFVKDTDGATFHGCKIHSAIHVPKSMRSDSFKSKGNTSSSPVSQLGSSGYKPDTETLPLSEPLSASTLATSLSLSRPASMDEQVPVVYEEPTSPASIGFKQVYVKGLPGDISQEELKSLLSKCGPVTDVFLQNVVEFKSAWAMVTFLHADSALKATSEFHRLVYKGRKLTCVKALKKNERLLQLSVKVPAITINKSKPHQKLYLYNLPPSVNENFFKLFLRGYTLQGSIIRFFISPKAPCSFIDFEKEDDAKAACLRLNGVELAGCTLKASLNKNDTPLSQEYAEASSPQSNLKPETMTQPVSAPVKSVSEAPSPVEKRFDSRTSSVAFFPSGFFPSTQVPATGHIVQDPSGSVYRLIPVPTGPYSTDSTRAVDVSLSPLLTRSSSIKEITEARKSGTVPEPVLVTLERMAPRFVDFLKYPSATRPKNLKRILQYFVDAYDRDDPTAIKLDIERIQRGDVFAETLLKERLIQTIELLGFSR